MRGILSQCSVEQAIYFRFSSLMNDRQTFSSLSYPVSAQPAFFVIFLSYRSLSLLFSVSEWANPLNYHKLNIWTSFIVQWKNLKYGSLQLFNSCKATLTCFPNMKPIKHKLCDTFVTQRLHCFFNPGPGLSPTSQTGNS